jgi:ankyrin repeat protein
MPGTLFDGTNTADSAAFTHVTMQAHRVSQADIRVRAELGQRLLAGARNNDTAEISRAVDLNADVNFVDPSTKAIPLYVATQQGHVDAITTILALSANIDAKNRHGLTALLGAIKSTQFSPKCRNCVTVLLDSGANPNEADADGDTPLLAACRFGDCDYIVCRTA